MKLPNGYGSVFKLAGNRRKPWAVRKTVGWELNHKTKRSKPIYHFVGYYESRKEALLALAQYNENPQEWDSNLITFEDVYEKWSETHYTSIKSPNTYKAVYTLCASLWKMKFTDIKLSHLQHIVDTSGKNRPTLLNLRNLFSLMWRYAVIHEIVTPDKRDLIKYLDLRSAKNPNTRKRKPFTKTDIQTLWKAKDTDPYISVVLILIYTGLRIGELLSLKKEDIHLDERWFYIKEAKTTAGVREVPIAEKIVPFIEYWLSRNCNYLICSPTDTRLMYRNYYDLYWTTTLEKLSLTDYTPHCTRHTCISLLTEAEVDERIIQQIVGHKGENVTRIVYTHVDLPKKLEAINRI